VINDQLEVRLIASRGYRRNLGPGRLVDHAQLAMSLSRLLRDEQPPDAAFVGFPPIEAAAVLTRWLRLADVPTLVDVKDAWPEIFLRAVPARAHKVGRLAIGGYAHLARRCLQDATGLSSITQEFLDWSLALAGRSQRDADGVFHLTAPQLTTTPQDLAEARDWWDDRGIPDDGRLRAYFVGSLHSSYDFGPVAEAARNTEFQFVICGDGSHAETIRRQFGALPNVTMPGWVTLSQAEALAERSTVSLAPIAQHPDFMMSLPNKYFDALSKGIPVVTGLAGALSREVTERRVGMSYAPDSGTTMIECLQELASDPGLVDELSRNSLALYLDRYQHETVYRDLAQHILDLRLDGASRK
jgi:glycosyltransferase involved in cell wall biosynthesis